MSIEGRKECVMANKDRLNGVSKKIEELKAKEERHKGNIVTDYAMIYAEKFQNEKDNVTKIDVYYELMQFAELVKGLYGRKI